MRQTFLKVTALGMVFNLLIGTAMSFAADYVAPKIDRLRGYLIWEESGELSKNVATEESQIVAVDREKGSSVQMLVDVVMTGTPDTYPTGEQPFLYVIVRNLGAQMGDPPMIDTGFPLSYVGRTGELVRSILVDHNCDGFELEAYVATGSERSSEIRKTFSLTCGD
jgi:hypothetical protein